MDDLARRLLVATVLCGATSLACPSLSEAQVPSPAKDPTGAWFQVTPYLWMASIKGENIIGDETIPIDVNFGDIWSALKFAFSFHFEGGKNHGLGGVDFAYIRLGEDDIEVEMPGPGQPIGDFRFTIIQTELFGAYRSNPTGRRSSICWAGPGSTARVRTLRSRRGPDRALMSARPGRISSRASASSPT